MMDLQKIRMSIAMLHYRRILFISHWFLPWRGSFHRTCSPSENGTRSKLIEKRDRKQPRLQFSSAATAHDPLAQRWASCRTCKRRTSSAPQTPPQEVDSCSLTKDVTDIWYSRYSSGYMRCRCRYIMIYSIYTCGYTYIDTGIYKCWYTEREIDRCMYTFLSAPSMRTNLRHTHIYIYIYVCVCVQIDIRYVYIYIYVYAEI